MGTAKVVNPDDIKCSIEFTLTLRDWKKVRETLQKKGDYPELGMLDDISDLIGQLQKTYYNKSDSLS